MSVEISITEETIETTVNGDTIEVNIVTPGSAGVVSFNSRTGIVNPASGDYTADQITETDDRVFVTPAQKEAIGTALQPEDVGTAADEDVEAFATAAQGELADTALQSLPTHGNEAHSSTFVDAAGAAAAAPVQDDDSRLTDKRDPNDHGHTETADGGTVAHSVTTGRDSADSHPAAAITPPPWYDASAAFTAGTETINYANGLAQVIDLGAGTAIDITAISNFPTGGAARMLLLFKSSGQIGSLAGPASSVLNGTFPGAAGKPLRVLVSQQSGDVGLFLKYYPEEAS